jgi:hypothetical protein
MYLHHECPLVILSPEDSKATITYPGVENRYGGKRAYIGQDSLDRQREHLKILLTFPEHNFLIHDSDSVNLDPKIPDYLYDEPDVVWSNQVHDDIPEHQSTFPARWPHVAFQPPYFLSRRTIEAMLAVADGITASPVMPFIDFYMLQLTMAAGLPWKRFFDCVSCPIAIDIVAHPVPNEHEIEVYSNGFKIAMNLVRNKGANILHSVKDHRAMKELAEAHRLYLLEQRQQPKQVVRMVQEAPHVGGKK